MGARWLLVAENRKDNEMVKNNACFSPYTHSSIYVLLFHNNGRRLLNIGVTERHKRRRSNRTGQSRIGITGRDKKKGGHM